jgi:hypothetical protein
VSSSIKRRYLRPECELALFMGRLLGARQHIDSHGTHMYLFKKTGHLIKVSPQWINEYT